MAKTIIWNRRASNSFNSIIEYLKSEWGDKVTRDFVVRSYKLIELLEQNPEMGPVQHAEKQIRGLFITKHNTMFYRIEEEKLILLNFFDNRRHPAKRDF